MKRLRREQVEQEQMQGDETARQENEQHIDDIAKEYGKLKRQRRLQRFNVSMSIEQCAIQRRWRISLVYLEIAEEETER